MTPEERDEKTLDMISALRNELEDRQKNATEIQSDFESRLKTLEELRREDRQLFGKIEDRIQSNIKDTAEKIEKTTENLTNAFKEGDSSVWGKVETAIQDIKLEMEKLRGGVTDLASELDRQSKELKSVWDILDRPWMKDRRFWAGFAALPALIISGWMVKAVFQDVAVLRLIHKGFGTELVVIEALDENDSLQTSVETMIRDKIYPQSDNFKHALTRAISDSFISKTDFSDDLKKEVGLHVRVRHVDVLYLGLTDFEKVKFVDRESDQDCEQIVSTTHCIDASSAYEPTTSSSFGAQPGQRIDISIGLNVTEVDVEKLRTALENPNARNYVELIQNSLENTTGSQGIDKLLTAQLEGEPIVFVKDKGARLVRFIDKEEYVFEVYTAKNVLVPEQIGADEFPLYTLKIDALAGNQNVIMTLPIVVKRPQELATKSP